VRPVLRFVAHAALVVTTACGAPPTTPPRQLPGTPLHLRPVSDLAPAAGVVWLVDARPRDLLAIPEMAAHVRLLVPDDRFDAFAKRHGGVDLRQLSELEIVGYRAATLFLARGVFDPSKVERAFAARAKTDGRAIDRQSDPLGTIVRTWGTVNAQREQIAIFGHEAIGLEIGRFGPLRAAEFFAEEKLKKSSPALRASPLARAAELAGAAPLRMFAPGPFEGDASRALGGLLRASTAIAIAVTILPPAKAEPGDEPSARLAIRVVLLGDWKEDAMAASSRLTAAIHTFSESALGRLMGLDHPAAEPKVRLIADDALGAELTLSALDVVRGLQMATGSGAEDVLLY
jgi:hypothetical protein